MMKINTYDIDGVIYLGPDRDGIYPGQYDVIITGRSFEEELETETMLRNRGIHNRVYYNGLTFAQKTRESSGVHKAKVIDLLKKSGYVVMTHFEDDPIQKRVIEAFHPDVTVVSLVHDLVEKENVRHELQL